MSEDKSKKCSRCGVYKQLNNFDTDKAQCEKCSEYKQRYRENHREQLRKKAKEIYEENKDEILEKKKEKVECPVCKKEISKAKMRLHEKTKRHIYYLNNPKQTKEELEKEKAEQRRKERIEHQKTIAYLNENFPYYPDE